MDEEIVYDVLADKENPAHPDLVVVVAEPNNIKRSIVLYQQARELGVPAIFVANMIDEANAKGIDIDYHRLEAYLHTKVYTTDARNGKGIAQLINGFDARPGYFPGQFEIHDNHKAALEEAKKAFPLHTEYQTWQLIAQENVSFLTEEQQQPFADIRNSHPLSSNTLQQAEAIQRNAKIDNDLKKIILQKDNQHLNKTNKIDKVLLHPVCGYIVFFFLLFLVFQLVFILSEPIMDWIDEHFSTLIDYAASILPEGPLSNLLTQGVLAGIGGIIIFVPQIAILFLLISLMEETGYMSRVVFLMD